MVNVSELHFWCSLRSVHDMIHRSMLIMNDQQSFMAMIIDHHVWSTGFHSMINRFHAWSTAFHSMINRYHAWSIAYHGMINKFHTWSTWSMIMNDHCSLISYMINSVHKAKINYQAHFFISLSSDSVLGWEEHCSHMGQKGTLGGSFVTKKSKISQEMAG